MDELLDDKPELMKHGVRVRVYVGKMLIWDGMNYPSDMLDKCWPEDGYCGEEDKDSCSVCFVHKLCGPIRMEPDPNFVEDEYTISVVFGGEDD